MNTRRRWTEQELLVALTLYCRLSFGQFHGRHPEIIKYANLINRTPDALAMKLSNFASLDPVITQSGRKGLEGASQTDKKVWNEMHDDWEGFAIRSQAAIDNLGSAESKEEGEKNYQGDERRVESKQRIGQDVFRASVLSAYDFRCCITGLTVPELLIASHIVPWSKDAKNRLNPRNGLALSALHDKAFDIGLLGVDGDYRVVISSALRKENDPFLEQNLWGYHGQKIILPKKFSPNPELLRTHFETIFIQ